MEGLRRRRPSFQSAFLHHDEENRHQDQYVNRRGDHASDDRCRDWLHHVRADARRWDIPQSELNKLKLSGKPIVDLTINSPVSGYITERTALPNMYVETATRLYTIADLSHVWVCYIALFGIAQGAVPLQ
jgi:hypothetical protein